MLACAEGGDLCLCVTFSLPPPPVRRHFLLLATIANVGKSIGVTTSMAVRAPIQKSFALQARCNQE